MLLGSLRDRGASGSDQTDSDPTPNKRMRDDDQDGEILRKLELLSKEDRGCHEMPVDREGARRARFGAASELLRQLVPGLENATDKTELLEMTAKYIVYLKAKVGGKYDKDFLYEFLPY